jgi:hypothetical protein
MVSFAPPKLDMTQPLTARLMSPVPLIVESAVMLMTLLPEYGQP